MPVFRVHQAKSEAPLIWRTQERKVKSDVDCPSVRAGQQRSHRVACDTASPLELNPFRLTGLSHGSFGRFRVLTLRQNLNTPSCFRPMRGYQRRFSVR